MFRPLNALIAGCLLAFLPVAATPGQASDAAVAARFAPVFYQALGEHPRSDYITNFDFDGDWIGNNNWANADDRKFPLKAFVYYSVSETATHYFVHYAVFHPRDYKGGEQRGRVLSELLRAGAKIVGKGDPSGLLASATAAHENDMEGALVVVAKRGTATGDDRVVFVETLAHNAFAKYARESPGAATFQTDGERPTLYIEPLGHGIAAYTGDERQRAGKEFVVYRYEGRADDPEQKRESPVGYDLLPIATTLWPRARPAGDKKRQTYGDVHDYARISINVIASGRPTPRRIAVGKIGSSFAGTAGGLNMARPPWGWFDINCREDPLGSWFFDPARIVKRDFNLGEDFSTVYSRLPFWAVK